MSLPSAIMSGRQGAAFSQKRSTTVPSHSTFPEVLMRVETHPQAAANANRTWRRKIFLVELVRRTSARDPPTRRWRPSSRGEVAERAMGRNREHIRARSALLQAARRNAGEQPKYIGCIEDPHPRTCSAAPCMTSARCHTRPHSSQTSETVPHRRVGRRPVRRDEDAHHAGLRP